MSANGSTSLEKKRIHSLKTYSILDSLSEEEYDMITRLAAQITGTPISLISLLDEDRQWFKSHYGLGVSETPLEYSFCAHAVTDPHHVMVVSDARLDERFKENPLVTGPPNIVFYTGVPLVQADGLALGTLCVIDNEKRQLSDSQVQALQDLAKQVMALLNGRKYRFELKRANETLRRQNDAFKRFAKLTAQLLKSPLDQITRYTDRYLNLHEKDLIPGHIESLLTTKAAADNMKTLIDGLLKNIDSKRTASDKREWVSTSYFEDYFSVLFRNSQDRKLEFNFKMEEADINKSSVMEVFTQLITNAFNFNDKDIAEVVVGGRLVEDYYEFYVSDNGPGIPVNEQDKIFEIFYVLQPFDRYGEFSTGIGLSTVRRLVHDLRGEVSLESSEGEGTIFAFSIPK
ncbi:MAG: sensor histidine kinase [Cyclobacteriaceae bacterium]|jgi:signal transduction histidine kinase